MPLTPFTRSALPPTLSPTLSPTWRHRPRVSRSLALAVALLAAGALVPGCAKSGRAKPTNAAHSATVAPATGAAAQKANQPPLTAVEISTLRERALAEIERLAQSSTPEVRGYAADAASLAPQRLQSVLDGALRDPIPGVRALACVAVADRRVALGPASRDAVLAAARDDNPFVRAAALYAATRLGESVDLTPLSTILTDAPTTRERAHAAFILGKLGNKSALPMLRDAGRAKIARARPLDMQLLQLQLGEARVRLGDEAPLQGIRAALFPANPDDLEAAVLAVQILGEVQDRGSVDQLIYMSAYRDQRGNEYPAEVRLAIATALAKMNFTQGSFIADEFAGSDRETLRAQAASVYGFTARRDDLRTLDGLLNDPSEAVRVAAAAAVLRAVDRAQGGTGSFPR